MKTQTANNQVVEQVTVLGVTFGSRAAAEAFVAAMEAAATEYAQWCADMGLSPRPAEATQRRGGRVDGRAS